MIIENKMWHILEYKNTLKLKVIFYLKNIVIIIGV